MDLIYRIFKFDKNSREGVVSATSVLSVIVNLFVALMKVVVGLLASSIAIISEGVNNATDALSSILTLVGTRLAQKSPDAKHPFGYGRIEYLTNMVIASFILVGGFEMLISSIKLIFEPETLSISYVSLFVVAASAIIKYVLGVYTINTGRRVGSGSLEAVGVDCRNDSFVSLVTIVSSLIYLLTSFSVDAFAGVFTSCLIIKAGVEILKDTISELLGQPADEELVRRLYKEIRSTEGIVNAVDMVLHNYGPDAYTGSCNVEVDHKMSVAEIYEILRPLQIRLFNELHVAMVFGIYAVDTDSKRSHTLRSQIASYVQKHEHIKSYHAIYSDEKSNRIYCDLVVDYEADRAQVYQDFTSYLNELYPDKEIQVNIDTEFV
ncbi:MAG: cation diffusion facilitator family transporter [Erysipelotrichaceae bacterium]|nr:cation diffusion facilitator family transporter [Erysipelotrichaceae bacterium]